MKRLSNEIKLANNAHIQIEETAVLFNKTSELPNDKGKISIHNKKKDIANQDLFEYSMYNLNSFNKNKKNNLINFHSCGYIFIKII